MRAAPSTGAQRLVHCAGKIWYSKSFGISPEYLSTVSYKDLPRSCAGSESVLSSNTGKIEGLTLSVNLTTLLFFAHSFDDRI